MNEGYKLTEIGELPIQWTVQKLGDIAGKVSVGFVGSINKYYSESNEVLLLRTGNIKKMV